MGRGGLGGAVEYLLEGPNVVESEWNTLSATVRLRRDCGRVHITLLPVTDQFSARVAADDAARSLGLNTLGSEWVEIAATAARRIATRILAYDSEVMPLADAERMAQAITSQAGADASFLTNAMWVFDGSDVWLSSWNPISGATFDAGVVCVGAKAVAMVWVEDED